MMPTAAEWEVILLSLRVSLAALALLLVPGVALGWLLARRPFPGRLAVEVLVHLPLVMPPVVTGWLLLVLCGRHGPVGQLLEATFGLRLVFTWQGAAVAAAVMAFPLLVRAARLAFEAQDRHLEEAAALCGARPWRVFRSISLPLAVPGIAAGLMLAFARCLGEFGATITLAGDIPGETRTLPVAVYALAQTPDGDAAIVRLVAFATVVSVMALAGSELLARGYRRRG
jgi:molybdate transport system permease protein